ncbi:hypothetical protein EVJ58_g10533 [Rhodofomes roseus]|uniref:Ketopantoate reductase C-terminal domain-containing protein n=1 Tax=Rhodofomes roseus TaxID=34475 RepID=A0A4Y9XP40_9APHY|nr:hypothetical protein EVJ58_g10533 [Rhodofomes roseus]
MGVYEQLIGDVFRNRLHRPHIVVSVNNHGAFVKDFGQVVHTGVGSIQLGIMADTHGRDFEGSIDTSLPKEEQKPDLNDITPLQRDPDATRYLSLRNTISALTSTTALDVSWRPLADVQLAMHRKLAVNCVINPLTALLACRNGDLFKHPSGRRLAAQICQEISNVFYAEWRREVWKIPAGKGEDEASAATDDSTDEDVTFVPSSIAFLPVSRRIVLENPFPAGLHQQQLLDECARVAELTRANVSSMLVDIRRGRPTEIHCLNGYILKLAKKHRVSVPVTAALIDLIHLRQKIPIDKPVPLLSVL